MRRGVASCGERFGPWCVRRGALLDLDQILTFNLQTMDPPFTLYTLTHTHTAGRTRHRPTPQTVTCGYTRAVIVRWEVERDSRTSCSRPVPAACSLEPATRAAMSQRSSRATPKGAKKAKRSKHDELEARPPPLRGDDAKERIHAMHVAAEQRYELQIAHRSGAAARHNVKAESVVVGKKEARKRAQQERKTHLEQDMAAHDERHKSEILRRQAKGSAVSVRAVPCVLLLL